MATTPRSSSHIRMGKQGRIVVPADLREALGFEAGEQLVASIDDGGLRISTVRANLDRARRIVMQHVPADRSLVDELIADRHAEAAHEDAS